MPWFHIPPAAEWQWVGLFTAIVAVIVAAMSLPTVFQMLWGKPNIMIAFNEDKSNNNVVLQCLVSNIPVKDKKLITLGVERAAAESVYANFSINESRTGRVVVPTIVPQINTFQGHKHKAQHTLLE